MKKSDKTESANNVKNIAKAGRVIITAMQAGGMYKVFVFDADTKEQSHGLFFRSALKALRYLFLLRTQYGYGITRKAIDLLKSENRRQKEATAQA